MGDVEKLRALLAEARSWDLPEEACKACQHPACKIARRIDAALAEPVSDDFKRGAEAMREAAAKVLDAERAEYGGGGDAAALCWQMATNIRALPVPEDK